MAILDVNCSPRSSSPSPSFFGKLLLCLSLLSLTFVDSFTLTSSLQEKEISSLSSLESSSSSPLLPSSLEVGEETRKDLPVCVSPDSYCGLVQLNGRGINRVQTCQCPNQRPCPLDWDPFSDHTLSHGNDHYKVGFLT